MLFELTGTCTEPLPCGEDMAVRSLQDIPRAVLLAAQRLHDFCGAVNAPHLKLSWRRNPVAGLRYASERADADNGNLLEIPDFVRSPSRAQRRWLQKVANGVVMLYAARFLYRNSPLNGSDNLRKWLHSAYFATLCGFRCAACDASPAMVHSQFLCACIARASRVHCAHCDCRFVIAALTICDWRNDVWASAKLHLAATLSGSCMPHCRVQ